MRLNKYDKEAFVRAVMADVPVINYEKQAHDMVRNDAHSLVPEQIRTLMEDKELKHYVKTEYIWLNYFRNVCNVVLPVGYRLDERPGMIAALDTLREMDTAQTKAINELEDKLRGVINSCQTLKKAKELLPEFEAYLPAERDSTTENLPAITNLVVDLTKLGWPKGKEKEIPVTA